MSNKKNNKIVPFIVNLLIPIVGGFITWYLNKESITYYSNNINKVFFTPPSIVFSIVWSLLYVLMGIAAYRVYIKSKEEDIENNAYFYYLIQLIFNFLWSFIFFTFRLYGISFIWLIILLIFVIITFIKFIKIDKISGFLFIPYIIWIIYAGVLNYFVWLLNEM